MAVRDAAAWTDRLRQALGRYAEPLLRGVADRLVKPRNQWPAWDLIDRVAATFDNPALIDRRLDELDAAGRQLLALIGHSRQPLWAVGNLVEMLMALGHADGVRPVLDLLAAGFLYPDVPAAEGSATVKTFEQWLAFPGPEGLSVFAPPQAAERAVALGAGCWVLGVGKKAEEPSGPPSPPVDEPIPQHPTPNTRHPLHEADGLEWPLRIAVLWQEATAAPLRRTQGGGFFKRDADRLGAGPLLTAPAADQLAEAPGVGFLVAAWGEAEGVLREDDGELRAGALPAAWEGGLAPALEGLYASLFRLRGWDALDGQRVEPTAGPFPSAYLLALLALAALPEGTWARPDDVQAWLTRRHPFWSGEGLRPSRLRPWLEGFLLGVAYHLRLVQAAKDETGWLLRLSAAGRWLLGLGEAPPLDAAFPRCLLVQPNLEVVAYRQGLTTPLIVKLTSCATWKGLGAACTLQLGPETVYRALELGQSFESIRLTLEQHGTRPVPPGVLDALRTWSDKRERLVVWPAATLLEFATAADLDAALGRGLAAERLSATIAVVASEEAIDFRNFRLTGTRDYGLPPERCVTVGDDGVSLAVDVARSDLMLETELPRFAERVERAGAAAGQRHYRLTPASLAAAREAGQTVSGLESWFQQRAGVPLPAAARLLFAGGTGAGLRVRRHVVVHTPAPELADGLMQWPETRGLIEARLGPTALAVAEDDLPRLRERLAAAGVALAE